MIDDLEFEWDEAKEKINLVKHGVSFFTASGIFHNARVERIDDSEDHDEERWNALGRDGVNIYRVTYTWRGDNLVRLISARRANEIERQIYYGQVHPAGN